MPRKTARGICKNASYQIRLLEAHSKNQIHVMVPTPALGGLAEVQKGYYSVSAVNSY